MTASGHYRWRQPGWLKRWLTPLATDPIERFCETILRVYLLVVLPYMVLSIPGVLLYERDAKSLSDAIYNERYWLVYYVCVITTLLLSFIALRQGRLRAAIRYMIVVYF